MMNKFLELLSTVSKRRKTSPQVKNIQSTVRKEFKKNPIKLNIKKQKMKACGCLTLWKSHLFKITL